MFLLQRFAVVDVESELIHYAGHFFSLPAILPSIFWFLSLYCAVDAPKVILHLVDDMLSYIVCIISQMFGCAM